MKIFFFEQKNNCASVIASIPPERFYDNNRIKIHHNHCFQVKHEKISSMIIKNSAVAGLTQYTNIWKNLFDKRFVNFHVSGDRVENVICRARDILFLSSLQNIVILCGTNNVNKDPPYDIFQDSIDIGSVFKNQSSNPNIFICGILPPPCSESFLINKLIINEVNDLLKSKFPVKNFHYINQSARWTMNNGVLNDLHLIEKPNLKLGKPILKALSLTAI